MSLITLLEWGKSGFGGYGRGFFTKGHRSEMGYMLRDLDVPKVAENAIYDFMYYALSRDDSYLTKTKFMSEVESGRARGNPKFEMRHFWYMAECIKHQPPQFRQFLANMMGEFFRRQNGQFRDSLWFKECHTTKYG